MNYLKPYIIYTDGVYDLFHRGHVESLKKCKSLFEGNTYLIVGVVSDNDATNYKRKPVYNEDDRYSIIENIKYVNKIIKGAPLIVTEQFLNTYNIDYVVHGFSNIQDNNKQDEFFKIPKQLNKFLEIDYYSKISTTDIIKKINHDNPLIAISENNENIFLVTHLKQVRVWRIIFIKNKIIPIIILSIINNQIICNKIIIILY